MIDKNLNNNGAQKYEMTTWKKVICKACLSVVFEGHIGHKPQYVRSDLARTQIEKKTIRNTQNHESHEKEPAHLHVHITTRSLPLPSSSHSLVSVPSDLTHALNRSPFPTRSSHARPVSHILLASILFCPRTLASSILTPVLFTYSAHTTQQPNQRRTHIGHSFHQ